MFEKFKGQHLAIAWSGLPPYAAYCLGAVAQQYSGKLTILGTKADVPHAGIEGMIGQEVHWLERSCSYTWAQLALPCPDHFIHTGWAYTAFNSLGADARQMGARCYSMIDTIWYNTLRQWIGMLYFRLVYRRWFDAVLVPGKAGRRFCRRLGMPDWRIFEGLYGANPAIFKPGPPLYKRPKRILFVGRLIDRKGLPKLIETIRQCQLVSSGWEFLFIGEGPFGEVLRTVNGVRLEPFSDAVTVAGWMRESRFLILPSHEENWGVVVHEAALSGCGLILAEGVGASYDLLDDLNGFSVETDSVDAIVEVIDGLDHLSDEQLNMAENTSRELAVQFGPGPFVSSVREMLHYHG